MEFFKRLFNFYISSSIHVALATCALTWVTYIQFEIDLNCTVVNFIFFATVTGYNFVKYFGVAKFHYRSLASPLRIIQLFSFLAFLTMCYYTLYLEINALLLLLILSVVTFLYAIPLLPEKYYINDQKNLRQISGLKIYVIALVWSLTTVLVPLVNDGFTLSFDVMIIGVQRFIYVIVLMLPFEIRDLNYDSLRLSTIPQKIGVKRTKVIGIILLMLFFLLDYFKDEISSKSVLSTLIITGLTLIFLICSKKEQSRYYSGFWVESLPIIWLGILLVLG